jgi:hypothetical protein
VTAVVKVLALKQSRSSAATGLSPFCGGGRLAYSARHSAAVELQGVGRTIMKSDYWKLGAACFQMTQGEREKVLPGWLTPAPLLDRADAVRVANPFTGEALGLTRRRPDEPLAPSHAARAPDLSSLPWIGVGGLMPWDFHTLAALLLNWTIDDARDALLGFLTGPEDANDILAVFPDELVASIADIPPHDLQEIAARWSALEPDALPPELAASVLQELQPFLQSAISSGRTCYLWSSR